MSSVLSDIPVITVLSAVGKIYRPEQPATDNRQLPTTHYPLPTTHCPLNIWNLKYVLF
ncbi:MAG: hypothetical protein LBG72_08795 [Spirochaetaceae bacterium]|nr:hypothetical protein [Spirochaetaceae bacterium]